MGRQTKSLTARSLTLCALTLVLAGCGERSPDEVRRAFATAGLPLADGERTRAAAVGCRVRIEDIASVFDLLFGHPAPPRLFFGRGGALVLVFRGTGDAVEQMRTAAGLERELPAPFRGVFEWRRAHNVVVMLDEPSPQLRRRIDFILDTLD